MKLIDHPAPFRQAHPENASNLNSPIEPVSVAANRLSSDGLDLWAVRFRIDRRHDSARAIAELRNGHLVVSLYTDACPLAVDDGVLETSARDAAEAWLVHTRQPSKRHPLLPQRRPCPSREHNRPHSNEREAMAA